jgi:hypothetical protein
MQTPSTHIDTRMTSSYIRRAPSFVMEANITSIVQVSFFWQQILKES